MSKISEQVYKDPKVLIVYDNRDTLGDRAVVLKPGNCIRKPRVNHILAGVTWNEVWSQLKAVEPCDCLQCQGKSLSGLQAEKKEV